MAKKSYVSYLRAKPLETSAPSTIPNSLESFPELRHQVTFSEAQAGLRQTTETADDEIDLQEMPEITQEEFERAVHGYLPVSETQTALWLDEEVKAWLMEEHRAGSREINHMLRREMQRQQRLRQGRGVAKPVDLARAS